MKPKLLVLTMLLGLHALLYGQAKQYQFSSLDINNGLSSNEITSIFKDAKGFLWFGTLSGLNRYDGYKFKVFKHVSMDSTSLDDDYIVKIIEGPNQKLWIQTRNGFNIYDPVTETFNHKILPYLNSIKIPNESILLIKNDNKGNYWFLHSTNGIYRYSIKDGQTLHLTSNSAAVTSLHSNSITDVDLDTKGNLWVIYNDGVIDKIDQKSAKVSSRLNWLHTLYSNASNDYKIKLDRQNDLWIYNSTKPFGTHYYNSLTSKSKHITKDVSSNRLNSNIVMDIVQDENGLIWIATDHGGINLLDKNTFNVKFLLSREGDQKTLRQNSITAFYHDNTGIIWIGTFKKGINYYSDHIIKFSLYKKYFADNQSLPYNDVNKFVEDKKGNFWIGTNGNGLIYFNRKSGTFKTYLHEESDPNSLSNNVIVSMCLDHEDKLWIGTYYGGLNCFDGKKFVHYRHSDANPASLADDRVWEIMEDSRNRLWVGTLSSGLDCFDRKTQTFKHYSQNVPNSVHSGYISALIEDRKKDLWIGTSYGISILDSKNKFRYLLHENNNPNSLVLNNINCLLQDSRQLMWIGTREGLSVYNDRTKKFTNLTKENGLPDNTILTLLEDDQHNVWISTRNGISKISVVKKGQTYSFDYTNYDESDGLQGREYNENAAYKTSKGELIFGGANGFNLFKPEQVNLNKMNLKPILTDLQIFNKSVGIGEKINGHVILAQSVTETKELILKSDENVFSIEFAALSYFNPSKVKFKYMLEGFDNRWFNAENNTRKATFTNLDPGEYIFRVRAVQTDKTFNQKELALKIKILPPIWKSSLAYAGYLIVFVVGLFSIRRRGIRKLRNEFAIKQERQEALRVHELNMMKIKFFTNVSHEFRTPISLIMAPIDKMLKSPELEGQSNQLLLIRRNAKRLLNMVNQLLDFRKMEVQELKLQKSPGDLIGFINEITHSFTDIAERKNIKFKFESDCNQLSTSFDHDKIERILFNLLSNAFKFTNEDGHIKVTVNYIRNESILKINVIDNGIGIPKDKQDKIFDNFFQNDLPGSMINAGSGIGLSITKEFVHLQNGEIYLESEPGNGSCFTVLFPIAEEANADDLTPKIYPERWIVESVTENKTSYVKPTKKKHTILLVEDNSDFRFYLKDNLKETYNIIESGNGKEGWQKALALHPHIIVSDVSMPEMSGTELCIKIKADRRTRHIPVVLLTARVREEQQLEGLETGADEYLTKPFNFEILLSKIRNLLKQQENFKLTFQKKIEVTPVVIEADRADEKFMQRISNLLERNLANPDFSVFKLSAEMNMSRVALYKKVTILTGKSPVEFIRHYRLQKAAQLLEKSQLTISEIAYQVGFNNPKYFTKYFKQEFGVLPSQFIS